MIVTTTETLTSLYTTRTLERSGLRVDRFSDVFWTPVCNVTAIQTTIPRKKNHAALLPIVELLREEFPDENVSLIADGLGCEFNLSNSKGRNDLRDRTTIIKLSWPHPSIVSTANAHQTDLREFERVTEPLSEAGIQGGFDETSAQEEIDIAGRQLDMTHDELIAILLGDLANQALGRNQGFRFQDREAILLIDSRWYPAILRHAVLRYRLTPWSTELPPFNNKTSKKSVWDILVWHGNAPSSLQKRLIELMMTSEEFGLTDTAARLVQKLPARQQALFQTWLEMRLVKRPEKDRAEAEARRKNRERVQRHRAKKKAAAGS